MLAEGNVFLWEEIGKSEQARWPQLFCSGSQSECDLPHVSHSQNQPNKGYGVGATMIKGQNTFAHTLCSA